MSWYFDPLRATQAAAYLLKCSGSDRMDYMKLLKLLCFSDRESIKETGYPITGDQVVAMKSGPVPSTLLNCIKGDTLINREIWEDSFLTEGYDVRLKKHPGTSELCQTDKRILKRNFETYKQYSGFQLSDISHALPEFVVVNEDRVLSGKGSKKIPVEETLKALGFSQEEIAVIKEKIGEERSYFQFFAEKSTAFHAS